MIKGTKRNPGIPIIGGLISLALAAGLLVPLTLLPSPAAATSHPEYQAQQQEAEAANRAGKTVGTQVDPTQTAECGRLQFSCNILLAINWVLDKINAVVGGMAAGFFESVLELNLTEFSGAGGYIQSAANIGWRVVLGIISMFFILWLLWMAIATIFDFETFSARKLLPRFIIAALLINFSFAIGTSFIRLTNGIAEIFAGHIERQGGMNNLIKRISNPAPIILTATNSYFAVTPEEARKTLNRITKDIFVAGKKVSTVTPAVCRNIRRGETVAYHGVKEQILAACAELEADSRVIQAWGVVDTETRILNMLAIGIAAKAFVIPISIFVLLAAGIFLLIRLVALMLLLVFAPIAFASLAIPGLGAAGSQVNWTGWWSSLVKWSFYLPAFLFLFLLSMLVLQGIAPESLQFAVADGKKLPSITALFISYALGMILLVMSLIVANQMGIHGAGMVTGWGKRLAGAAGKWTRDRGWKYAGRLTEAAVKTPGLGRIVSALPPLRAGATALMTRGTAVEKRDTEFYRKLQDTQLAPILRGMRQARAEAIWNSLPANRKREARPDLAELARERKWRDSPPVQPPQAQTIHGAVMPIIDQIPAVQQLPQELRTAFSEGIRRATESQAPDASVRAVNQAIVGALGGIAQAQTGGLGIQAAAAVAAIERQSAAIRGAVALAQQQNFAANMREQMEHLTSQIEEIQRPQPGPPRTTP